MKIGRESRTPGAGTAAQALLREDPHQLVDHAGELVAVERVPAVPGRIGRADVRESLVVLLPAVVVMRQAEVQLRPLRVAQRLAREQLLRLQYEAFRNLRVPEAQQIRQGRDVPGIPFQHDKVFKFRLQELATGFQRVRQDQAGGRILGREAHGLAAMLDRKLHVVHGERVARRIRMDLAGERRHQQESIQVDLCLFWLSQQRIDPCQVVEGVTVTRLEFQHPCQDLDRFLIGALLQQAVGLSHLSGQVIQSIVHRRRCRFPAFALMSGSTSCKTAPCMQVR